MIAEARESLQAAFNNLDRGFVFTLEMFNEGMASLDREEAKLKQFTLRDYFDHMAQNGSHGSFAEFYAISKIFDVNIHFKREQADGTLVEQDRNIDDLRNRDTIWVVLNRAGNHFDSLIPHRDENYT